MACKCYFGYNKDGSRKLRICIQCRVMRQEYENLKKRRDPSEMKEEVLVSAKKMVNEYLF